MNELQIIDDTIAFRGVVVAILNKSAPASLMGDFRDNINKLILSNSQMEELSDILDDLNQASSSVECAESNLSYFLNKLKRG